MHDLKDISEDFLVEVEEQGEKIDEMNDNLEMGLANAVEATKELQKADKTHRRTGKCLIVVAVVIVLILGALVAVLFGAKLV